MTVIFPHTHNPARKCYSHFICKAGTVSVVQRVNCVAYGTFTRVDKPCISPIFGHCKWLLIVAFSMWTFSKTHTWLSAKRCACKGFTLQLKIKHCSKLFLFKMWCCVLAWMNEYIVQIISATRLWLISRYSHHTLKKHWKMTAQNDIHVPSDFRRFNYKQIASTWSNNHWLVRGKHRFIWII